MRVNVSDVDRDRDGDVEWAGCFDGETEVLTAAGWKRVAGVRLDDAVATLEQETFDVEYHQPRAKRTLDYDGDVIHWAGNTYDLCVTPDQSVFARSSPGQPFANHPAHLIEDHTALSLRRGGTWSGEVLETFTPAPAVVAEGAIAATPPPAQRTFDAGDWVTFLGWYVAEGSALRKDTGNHRVSICQRNSQYRPEIRALLERMGFSVYMGAKNIEFDSKQVVDHVEPFGPSGARYVPDYLKAASPRLIRAFLTAYAKGDGSLRDDGTPRVIYTSSERMADDLQELGMKAAWPAVKGIDDRTEKGTIDGYAVTANGPVYRVSFAPSKAEVEVWTESTREHYAGPVYGFVVPNRTLYVRRNGRPVWAGT